MSIDLSTTLSWTTATGDAATMLGELQPNILKAHVRDHLSALFLAFGDAAEARTFLGSVTGKMKSAKAHLDEVSAFKTEAGGGTPYVGVGLTAAGYRVLGVENFPQDQSFLRGMTAPDTRQRLNDPRIHFFGDVLLFLPVRGRYTVVPICHAPRVATRVAES